MFLPRLAFSNAWHGLVLVWKLLHILSRLAPVACFPALCTGCVFSRAWHRLYNYMSVDMNMGKSTDYESILRMADMNTLEHRRIEQSLTIFFKCFKENGPGYVANLFKSRVTPYNLRSNGLNVVQTSYNSRFLHGSYAYMISHIWNQLPSAVKNAPNASPFRRLLTKLNFNGCQCSNCL